MKKRPVIWLAVLRESLALSPQALACARQKNIPMLAFTIGVLFTGEWFAAFGLEARNPPERL